MLVSMTGFGQGEASNRYGRVAVEMRTVNHRYLDLSIKLPKSLSHREHEVKDLIKGRIRRGRISINVSVDGDEPEYDVRLNVPLMEQYVLQLKAFAKKHGLSGDIDVNTLAGLPEVFQLVEKQPDADRLWPLVRKAMKQAAEACNTMREEEGRVLEADLRKRVAAITAVIKKVETRAPKVVAHHGASLRDRLNKILEGANFDQDRWMTEVAVLADRLDFTEEVTRLKSHVAQIEACLNNGGAVSKKLTYLLQEVHREATTIGAKAADAEVIEQVVALKEESERLREQVQNVE